MKSDWLQRSQYITMMGVEAAWFYALISILNTKIAGGPVNVYLLLVFLPSAFILNKLIQKLRWHVFFALTGSWLVWAVFTLILTKIQLYADAPWLGSDWLLAIPGSIPLILEEFPAEVLVLITTPFLWWLGQRLAYMKLSFHASIAEFQFGLVMLLFTFLIGTGLGVTLSDAVPVAMFFFAFALLGMAVAHARENSAWSLAVFRAHWPGLVVLSIGAVLAGGLILGVVMSPGLLQGLIAVVKWAWGMFIKFMEYLASLIPPQPPVELPPGMSPLPSMPPEEPLNIFSLSETWRKILQILLAVSLGGTFLVAVWRTTMSIVEWFRRRLAAASGGEYERLDEAFSQDIISLLKSLIGFLFHRHGWRRGKKIPQDAATVRQVYRQLLRWAADHGYPKRAWETPYEYLSGALAALVPEKESGLSLSTDQYVKTRYGELLPSFE